MRILVIGGTRFVGRHLVAAGIARGHDVTVLHRGRGCDAAPDAEHLHADRDGDLGVLTGRDWDATVDTSAYWPAQVQALADALGERGGRHLLVSTVSVYADELGAARDEDAPLHPPLGLDGSRPQMSGQTYGPLKVGCEQVAQRVHVDLRILRPTYVFGPFDHTGRFGAWVDRARRGGRILVPGLPASPLQYIDARDLAGLGIGLVEGPGSVTVHATVPPPFTWGDLMATLVAAVAPPGTQVEWVGSAWLDSEGITPERLPLWTCSDDAGPVMAMDPARALAAGLQLRPLAQTVRDVADWLPADGSGVLRSALTPQRESELLGAWDAR